LLIYPIREFTQLSKLGIKFDFSSIFLGAFKFIMYGIPEVTAYFIAAIV